MNVLVFGVGVLEGHPWAVGEAHFGNEGLGHSRPLSRRGVPVLGRERQGDVRDGTPQGRPHFADLEPG